MESPKENLIVNSYATSFVRLASKENKREVLSLFLEVSSMLTDSDLLRSFFESPVRPIVDKKRILKMLFQKLSLDNNLDCVELLHAFFQTIVLHHREALLSNISRVVKKIWNESEGRYSAEVTVSRDISLDELSPLLLKVVYSEYKKFGLNDPNSTIVFSKKVSTDILGSFVLNLQGYSLDLSFASYLKRWKKLDILQSRNLKYKGI